MIKVVFFEINDEGLSSWFEYQNNGVLRIA